MRFSVLALDYDGTIARNGALEPDVRQAIAEARARGIVVVIVTGRILSEFLQAAGDLQFVDAVVAENGAVLASEWAIAPLGQIASAGVFRGAPKERNRVQIRAIAFWKLTPGLIRESLK
jgi:hydroxymethylpyrimidine pyrophosphatase-like HAD family hydrolase